jgi:hypothetical protein
MSRFGVVVTSALLVSVAAGAQASIIPIGSSFTLVATNAPDNYTANTTFGSTVLVDGGAAQLSMSQMATGPNSEWDIWTLTTTSGAPIAGNTGAYWDITMDYQLSAKANFDAVLDQWLSNGVPITPTGNIGSICCAGSTNPVNGGGGFYDSGFSAPLDAGTQSNWDQIYVDPYDYVTSGGIPLDANGFTWALHFTLQTPVATPEPGGIALFATPLIGLALLRRRRGH